MNKYKEMIRRSLRTFIQAAVGYIATHLVFIASANTPDYDYIKNAVIGIGVSAAAAGIAAVMNRPKDEDAEG